MRGYLFVLIAGCAFAWAASTSRPSAADGPAENSSQDTSNAPEPITGEVAVPVPSAEPTSAPRDPFSPYGIGETTADSVPGWAYEQLSSEEKAQIDAGRDVSGWAATHNAYKSAVALRAAEA